MDDKKLQEGIKSFFAGFAILKRLSEKQDEIVKLLAEAYKILVYVVEGRKIEEQEE